VGWRSTRRAQKEVFGVIEMFTLVEVVVTQVRTSQQWTIELQTLSTKNKQIQNG
jgi:hypothetical protein